MEIELLVRAVIRDKGRLLITHTKGADNVYLPGGHVEPGEGTVNALARELEEELGVDVLVGEYLGAVEHEWEVAGVRSQEINHLFVVTSPELLATHSPESREDYIEFTWISPSEFEERNLQPAPLRQLLSDLRSNSRRLWWASTMEPRNG